MKQYKIVCKKYLDGNEKFFVKYKYMLIGLFPMYKYCTKFHIIGNAPIIFDSYQEAKIYAEKNFKNQTKLININ